MNKQIANPKVITVAGGFYFFGNEIPSDNPDYIKIDNGAMSGGFSGGKGIAGVCRGDNEATIILDRFQDTEVLSFPLSAVYAILPCVNLYEFKGTTIR